MILFYALILALNDGPDVGWQVLLQRAFAGTLRRIFTSFALGEYGAVVHPRDSGFDIDPTAVSSAGG